jgi:hypothetical protein
MNLSAQERKLDWSWIQANVGYDQFEKGFFSLGADITNTDFYTWYGAGVNYGYSPWNEIHQISATADFGTSVYGIGPGVGLRVCIYTRELNTNTAFRPYIGLTIQNIFRLNIGYNILTNNFHKADINRWVLSTTIGIPVIKK